MLSNTLAGGVWVSRTNNRRMLRRHHPTTQSVQWLLMLSAVSLLLYLLVVNQVGRFSEPYRILMVISVLLSAIVYRAMGVFSLFEKGHKAAIRLLKAWAVTLALLLCIGFVMKLSETYSRQIFLLWAAGGAVVQFGILVGTRIFARVWTNGMKTYTPSLVVGSGDLANHLVNIVNRNAFITHKIIGVVETDAESSSNANPADAGKIPDVPSVGTMEQIQEIVERHNIERVYLALPFNQTEDIMKLYNVPFARDVDIVWAPDIFGFHLINPSVREISGIPLVSMSETPHASGVQAFLKKQMDFWGALVLLILLSPVFLGISAAIKLSSPGPVIYRQKRHGWDGREFVIWKFRSMKVEEETPGGVVKQATKTDDRVTTVGRIIRRTSLDELPQLIQVLTGKMSLVGPRPHAISHNQFYADKIDRYMARHRIKPGMTGWAQVLGMRGETETVEKMQRRVQLDIEYINNWSLSFDIWILLRTPLAVLTNKDVY
ncbi:MAG: undecaprenyl-phosphate glucose phosphotransferase [Pseudomonadota bacterium]